MTAIVVALLCEGQAIALHYGITLESKHGFSFGTNEDIAIIVSGVGGIKMACAIGFIQAKFAPLFWINIGVAGAINRHIGELFWIDKITKDSYVFYPDMLLKANLNFASLHSCHEAKVLDAVSDVLYDMEGYDFAYTASMFCKIDKIALLKVISDNCDGTRLDAKFVSNLIDKKLLEIISFIELFKAGTMPNKILDSASESCILEACSNLRLTHSQSMQLINKAKSLARRDMLDVAYFVSTLLNVITNAKNKKLAFNEFIKVGYDEYKTNCKI